MTTSFKWGSALNVGQVRQVNQDHVHTGDGLFAVADGMGGHRAGEVASEVAIGTLVEQFTDRRPDQLVDAVQEANAQVVRLARDNPDLRGMGTTLSALALTTEDDHDVLAVANVGDSRTYLLRAESEELEQVTEDHSLVATLERQGQLTRDEAAVHPQRNILTRALGIDGKVLVDLWELEPVKGDRYLLCSDGLFNEVDEPRIAAVLRRLADPDEAAAELVRLANEHGGRDNISVVIVDVVDAATDGGSAPGRVRRVTHGESRAGATTEAIPARKAAPGAPGTPGTNDATDTDRPSEPKPTPPKGPRSRLTWRVGAFVIALLVIFGATAAVVSYVHGNTYHVGIEDDEVVIYEGPVGGTLWLEPTVVASTGIAAEDVPADKQNDLDGGMAFTSRDEADAYVATMQLEIDRLAAGDETGAGIGSALGGDATPSTTAPSTTVAGAAPVDPAAGVPPASPTTLVP
jgi:protein phosphatase